MKSIIRFTLGQRVLFNLVFVLLMVAGAFTLGGMSVERYPEINFGKVFIGAFYPGASPRDVEALVTTEIEEALEGLEDVEFIRATSARERATLVVKFRDDSNYEALYDDLRFRVLSMLDELPEGVDPPAFELITTSTWLPVVSVNLVGERSNRALTLMAEELQVQLARIPGMKEAEITGDYEREFQVYLDPNKLNQFGVSYEQAAAALTDANLALPAGDYRDASGEYIIRVDERFRTREELVSTVVRSDADGSFVTIADLISAAYLDYRDPHLIASVNGKDAVTINIRKASEANALTIMDEVQRVIDSYQAALAKQGVEVILTQDSTTYIRSSISTLGWNLFLGIVLVSALLYYFMGIRNSGLVTVGIPFAFLVTLILTHLTGNSLNEITLFSFVLVSGIIVDDAIVIVENIYRHVQQGEPLDQAIVEGTAEVMMPVISATMTTVAAFLPMLIMTGSTGEFFALIPKAVSFAIIASLLECLFILPIHYLDYGPRQEAGTNTIEERDPWLLRILRRWTDRLIGITMRFRHLTLWSVVAAFFASIGILAVSIAGVLPLVPIKFFPDDYNLYYAFIEGPTETPVEETDARVRAIADFILADGPGYAKSAAGFAGLSITEDYEQVSANNLGTVMVPLPATEERAFTDPIGHLDRMRERLEAEFERDGFEVSVRAEKDGPPTGKDVNITVVGSNEASVVGLASAVLEGLHTHPEFGPQLVDLEADRGQPSRVFRLEVDAARAREFGLTQGEAARLAASVLDGRYIGKFRASDEEIDLKLSIDPRFVDNPEAALDIPVLEHPSGPVYLRDIIRPIAELQPGELKRYQGRRSIAITANIKSAALSPSQVVAWVSQFHDGLLERYPGAALVYGGEFEETQRSFQSLTAAFALAATLIYLILAAQFRSYIQPLIVLSAVMFSLIGVVFGKLVFQSMFTINSFIALVGVTGVVVNDALVLLDFINRRYRDGMSRREAVAEGVRLRLRPIILTTLTTSLGLLPMALGIPTYSVIWGTMASTFVTGLATATMLTLFVVPVAWDLLAERGERRAAKRASRANVPDDADEPMVAAPIDPAAVRLPAIEALRPDHNEAA